MLNIEEKYLDESKYFLKFIKFTKVVNVQLELEKVLQKGCNSICELLNLLGCQIMLYQPIKEELCLTTRALCGPSLPPNVDEIIKKSYLKDAVTKEVLKQPMVINDSTKDPRSIKKLVKYIGHKSLLRVPIISGDEVIGATVVYSKEYNYFDESKVIFLKLLSDQLGIAINNARIIKQNEAERELHSRLNTKEKELEKANYYLNLEEQIRQNEKFSVVGKLAAGLAHEIRNPMTSIKGFLQLIFSNTDDKTTKNYLNIVLEDLERICNLVNNFLLLSKPSAPKFDIYNINSVLNEVLEIMKSDAMENDISLQIDLSNGLPQIYADKEQFKQVVVNIIRNSIEALKEQKGSKGVITVHTYKLPNEDLIRTTIADNGPGISKENQSKIFDPFFTTKDEGTGLGLSVSYQIIENMYGRISLESEEGSGTATHIDIPINIQ